MTPEGFETNLPEEAQAVMRRIQQDCSEDGNRGLLAASHSWRANLGGKPMDGVICDLLLISRNMGGLHLITVCQDESEGYLRYSKEVAQNIKEVSFKRVAAWQSSMSRIMWCQDATR